MRLLIITTYNNLTIFPLLIDKHMIADNCR